MFGLLLNVFNKIFISSQTLADTVVFYKNTFGAGTTDRTVSGSMSIADLSASNGNSLEFANLTISQGSTLLCPKSTSGATSVAGRFAPAYIKCSNKLTIAGTLSATGTGSQQVYSPLSNPAIQSVVPITIPTSQGKSVDTNTFFKLLNYGNSTTFFQFNNYLVGGAGGGVHSFSWFNPGGWFWDSGISSGGCHPSNAAGWAGGGGGGFIAIYYKELIINGKVYGKDQGCEVWRIQANGPGGLYSPNGSAGHGGGCIILSAKTLEITGTGQITANGTSGAAGGTNFAFLNNLPQLGINQSGAYISDNTGTVTYGVPASRTYYYDDGTGNYLSIDSGSVDGCGGAGMVIGYRVTQ